MGFRRTVRKWLGYKEPEEYLNISFAQEGEDMLLDRILNEKAEGFFVDVGALHPTRFSNTYKFYKRGWRGISIDALPGSMKRFNDVRPRDINLEIPVSDKKEHIPFYVFNEPALNTFSKELAEERNKKEIFYIEKTLNLETQTLSEILERYLPEGQPIDFFTIDVEGFDLQVLKSNDWLRHKPSIVVIETEISFDRMENSEVYSFLTKLDYTLCAKTLKTCFFSHSKFNLPS
ncbi:FkbM family methyltransferase [Pedobacter sp. SYP-B3415]|uniref:FkbM family methyltransferase n=1 Tax=Pedobacter sp. SYP-B3415 TaxID=2496641 RepID=UPI00197F6FD2|nr:FkbM family methyltransferase [Pedobacter sp. SYP-B3415]